MIIRLYYVMLMLYCLHRDMILFLTQLMQPSFLFKDMDKKTSGMINGGVGEGVSRFSSGSVEPLGSNTLDAIEVYEPVGSDTLDAIEVDTIVLERNGEGSIHKIDNGATRHSFEEDVLLSNGSLDSPGLKFKADNVEVNLNLNVVSNTLCWSFFLACMHTSYS